MIAFVEQLVKKYDAATVFVAVATAVVIVELSLMRLLVPESASGENYESGSLMEQMYSDTSVAEISKKLVVWKEASSSLVDRLSTEPESWQKELQTTLAFGFEPKPSPELIHEIDEMAMHEATADYAANQLYLKSIMTGNTPLANINGNIYRVGDDISLRDGEIVLEISTLGSDYAIVQIQSHPEIKRTIYLSRDTRLVNGEQLP